jgi:PAS domain S-box-containing protein
MVPWRTNWPKKVALVVGVAVSAYAAAVLTAWVVHFVPLIQLSPGQPPLTRQGALTQLLLGASLVFRAVGRRRAAILCATIAFSVAVLVGFEYVLDRDFGIDQLLGVDYIHSTSPPGRISPVAALCYLSASVALLAMSIPRLARYGSAIGGMVASVLIATGTVMFLGYGLGQNSVYAWGRYRRISVQAAAVVAVLGAAIMVLALDESRTRKSMARWLPLALGVSLSAGTLGVWQALMFHEQKQLPLLWHIILAGGILGSLLVAIAVFLAQKATLRSHQFQGEKAAFERLFEASPDSLLVINGTGRILGANQRTASTFGYSREELLGLSIESLIPEMLSERHRTHGEGYYSHPSTWPKGRGLDLNARRKDGSDFPVDVSLSALHSGGELQVLAAVRDITERRHAEQAVRESEQRFRGVFETSPLGLALIPLNYGQLDFGLAKVNASFCRMFGYSEAELMAQNSLDLTHPDDREMSKVLAERLSRGEIPYYRVEKRYLKKDGEIMWGTLTATIVRDREGRPLFGLGMIEDITERKVLEQNLDAAREQAISSARLSALGMMAGGVAHEINNPLSIIHAMASDLGELVAEQGSVPAQVVARKSAVIRETAERIAKIVKSLRQISREGSNDLFHPTPVAKILLETLEICRAKFKASGVELLLPQAIPEVSIPCREVQIAQALLNLLQNAFDAALERDGDRWVRLEVKPGDGLVAISIIDSGPGIPSELRSRIGQPFFTTKPVGKGTGLGLSLSKSIAEEHGGTLEYSDDHGHTRFSLVLPLAREVKAA